MVDAGSLMKASERLHVAQPALSVHLANLEGELGTQLVKRSNRGIELTDDGRLLYDRAVIMLRHHQETLNELKSRKNKTTGRVSLGLPSTLPALISAQLYRMVREKLPEVHLYIADTSTAALFEWLQEGKLDLAVLFNLPENSGVDFTPLYVEEFCLVGKPQDKPVDANITFEEMIDFPLVLPCRSTVWRKVIDDVAERQNRDLRSVIETESFTALRAMAMSGECYTLLPRSSVLDDIQSGRLQARRIIDPEMRGLISVASISSRELTRAAVDVRDIVIDVCRGAADEFALPDQHAHTGQALRGVPSTLFPMARVARR
ncbi:LysR family transcriptional regulator [Sphingomonas koreensis]|uniref:LysR family transcriptional regulator n=2 Tax=Sphingomonas koreensis TaxID=93064 RepID=A0A430G218_9SPHN|nr:LysR family transcriptional regulator [Sphingomonas koreensis]